MSPNRPKIIVVGGGTAGCMAALTAKGHGAAVTLITNLPPIRSRSAHTDGLASALNTKGEKDSPNEHARDTIVCGEFLAHQGPVKKMCEAAPQIVSLFDQMGAMFDRTGVGTIELGRSFGQVRKRIVAAGLNTGHQIQTILDRQIRRAALREEIKLLEGWEFLSPIMGEGGTCLGITAVNVKNMEVKAFPSDAVILCTGGYVGLFGRFGTHPAGTGAAAAVCFRCGAQFANPEFIQVHPYTIASADKCVPIGVGVFSAGARVSIIRDGKPWGFLDEWFPDFGAFVSSDVAARAIYKATKDGETDICLDLSMTDPEWLSLNFKEGMNFYEKTTGDDPCETPMKLTPAAHLTLGGLWVDERHATSIEGLFAAGGCASIYHGGCALGGNETLSSLYGGRVAGECAVQYAKGLATTTDALPSSIFENARVHEEDANAHITSREGDENVHILRSELAEAISACAEIARDDKKIGAAAQKIAELKERLSHARLLDRSEWANSELLWMRRLKACLDLAEVVAEACLARNESRGVHFKPAFPKRDDKKWLVTTIAKWSDEGPRLDYSETVRILDFEPPSP